MEFMFLGGPFCVLGYVRGLLTSICQLSEFPGHLKVVPHFKASVFIALK